MSCQFPNTHLKTMVDYTVSRNSLSGIMSCQVMPLTILTAMLERPRVGTLADSLCRSWPSCHLHLRASRVAPIDQPPHQLSVTN